MFVQSLKKLTIFAMAITLVACGDASYLQKESPVEGYKDYKGVSNSVIGVGKPVSERQMKADATFTLKGEYALEDTMSKLSNVYNLAIRYATGVRKDTQKDLIISELAFNQTRNYIEDVYAVQIVREGERRLLVLPSIDEKRIEKFAPGMNVSLSQIVRGLAKQCNYNMVITENKKKLITTLVTTSFKDISCLDAFDAVLTPHGLSLVDNGNHYSVGGFPQRQWILDLFEPERKETQNINYSSSFSGEGSSGSTESGGSGNISMSSTRNLWDDLEEDLTALVDKSCEEMRSGMQSLLAAEDGGAVQQTSDSGSYECGYVRINRTVGMIQMRAPQSVLNSADEIVRHVKDIASRRLMVEARIIAVAKKHGFEQGSEIKSGHDEGDTYGFASKGQNVSIAAAISNGLLGMSGTGYGGAANYVGGNLDAAVNLAENFGTTYQLMQPMMEVMDRQKAIMIDGRNEKYFLITEEVEDDGDPTTIDPTTTSAEEKTQFVGVQFAVTAQVADEGEPHTLSVQIPMTEIERFVVVPDGTGSEVPVVTTRVIDQKVRIRDGEVKVIGGLTRTLAVDKESGVPLIRGIPMAGKLFNDENISYENVEFIVLLQVKRLY
ncbi:MAG: hypothetical protein ACI9TY_000415 [Alphaproteobacteria bacterium]|jgi:hypothetical protein